MSHNSTVDLLFMCTCLPSSDPHCARLGGGGRIVGPRNREYVQALVVREITTLRPCVHKPHTRFYVRCDNARLPRPPPPLVSGSDRWDGFPSLMDNVRQQANFAWFQVGPQSCVLLVTTDAPFPLSSPPRDRGRRSLRERFLLQIR